MTTTVAPPSCDGMPDVRRIVPFAAKVPDGWRSSVPVKPTLLPVRVAPWAPAVPEILLSMRTVPVPASGAAKVVPALALEMSSVAAGAIVMVEPAGMMLAPPRSSRMPEETVVAPVKVLAPESVKTPSPTLAKASLLEAPSAKTPAKFEVPKVESSDSVDVTAPAAELVTVAAWAPLVRAERVWLKPAKSRTEAPDDPSSSLVCAGIPSLIPAKRLPC